MKASQINYCQANKTKAREDLLTRLRGLGFNYEAHSFGVSVLIGGRLMFHGREDEITKWLEELQK